MAGETIDYAAVLADLESKRAVIDNMIAGARQMLNLGVDQGTTAQSSGGRSEQAPTKVQFDSFFRMTMPDAITKYLEIAKRPQTVSEITKALREGGLPSSAKHLMPLVGSRLSGMKKAGEVANVQGKWGLASWYPAVSRQAAMTKSKGKKQGRPKASKTKPAATKSADPPKPEPKAPASQLTPEQNARIKALHAAGKKPGEIATEVGLHRLAVGRILKRMKAA